MDAHIGIERRPGVVSIAINRPERKNAITTGMYAAMADALVAAEADASVEVVVLRGAPGMFSAGNDLGDFVSNPPASHDSPVFRFMRALLRSTRIVVAGVSGPAVGIGTTLLLHCDLVVAATDTRFVVPFSGIGLVPEFASSRLLPARMGRQRAGAHLLLGEPFDAQTAFDCGFVTRVVEPDALDAALDAMVEQLLARPREALALTKRLLAGDLDDTEALIGQEGDILARCLAGAEFREAATAFAEKRPPVFRRGGGTGA